MNDTLETKVQELLALPVDGRVLAECAATAGVADGTRLRSALEERALEEARAFLAAYDALGAALDPMDAELAQLARAADALRSELDAAVDAAAPLLERAGVLRGEQADLAAERDACRALGARFQLTAAEERALAGPAVDAALLAALDRASAIRDDARALLQTSQHRLGIAVMTRMSTLVEDALWRIAHWVRARLAEPDAEPEPDAEGSSSSSLLAQCLARLRHTEMFGVCLDEVAAARARPLTQGFVAALTAGTPQTRPIEMHAHDPVRFVGDMLAWLHQAVAAEYEAVSALLLGSDSKSDDKSGDKDDDSVACVLRREFEGVCRPFQVRVEQTLAQKTATAAVLLRVGGLLAFYRGVVGGLLGAAAPLTAAIGACEAAAAARLDAVLRAAVHRLDAAPPVPPPDLQPPPAVRQTVALVAELCAAAAGATTACPDRLAAAVQGVVAPLVAALEHAAAAALDDTSHSVFLVNCLSSVLAAVAAAPPLAAVAADLRAHLDGHVRTLVAQQAARFLGDCGLAPKLAILEQQQQQQEGEAKKPLATVLGMEPRAVESAVRAFESALLDISSRLVQPAVERLLNPRYCAAVRRGVADLVARRYAAFHAAVTDPAAGYPENGARVFHYAPAQVSVMLDV